KLQFRKLLSIYFLWDCFNLWADIGNEKDRPGNYSLSEYPVHQLPTTNYQLPTTNYQLPTTNYQLPTTNKSFSRWSRCHWFIECWSWYGWLGKLCIEHSYARLRRVW
ncbi:hypothetical protein RDJ44_004418, partial [Salmonella enterica]|nr:hypothetical protein [Salmonella enterica]EKY7722029.1 hypothetical protein [Salmonella enterica]